jgi:hypothetical protein
VSVSSTSDRALKSPAELESCSAVATLDSVANQPDGISSRRLLDSWPTYAKGSDALDSAFTDRRSAGRPQRSGQRRSSIHAAARQSTCSPRITAATSAASAIGSSHHRPGGRSEPRRVSPRNTVRRDTPSSRAHASALLPFRRSRPSSWRKAGVRRVGRPAMTEFWHSRLRSRLFFAAQSPVGVPTIAVGVSPQALSLRVRRKRTRSSASATERRFALRLASVATRTDRCEVVEVRRAAERDRIDVIHRPIGAEPDPARLAPSVRTDEHKETQTLTGRAGRRSGVAAAFCLTGPRRGRMHLAATPADCEPRAPRLGAHPSCSHHGTLAIRVGVAFTRHGWSSLRRAHAPPPKERSPLTPPADPAW